MQRLALECKARGRADIGFALFTFNSSLMQLSLDADQIVKLRTAVQTAISADRLSLRDLQVLCGRLNWACVVIKAGRPWLRALIDMLPAARSGGGIPMSSAAMVAVPGIVLTAAVLQTWDFAERLGLASF